MYTVSTGISTGNTPAVPGLDDDSANPPPADPSVPHPRIPPPPKSLTLGQSLNVSRPRTPPTQQRQKIGIYTGDDIQGNAFCFDVFMMATR